MRDGTDGFCRRVLVSAGPVAGAGTVECEVSRENAAVCWEREVLGLFSVEGRKISRFFDKFC